MIAKSKDYTFIKWQHIFIIITLIKQFFKKLKILLWKMLIHTEVAAIVY